MKLVSIIIYNSLIKFLKVIKSNEIIICNKIHCIVYGKIKIKTFLIFNLTLASIYSLIIIHDIILFAYKYIFNAVF